jgi:hypothetical protein
MPSSLFPVLSYHVPDAECYLSERRKRLNAQCHARPPHTYMILLATLSGQPMPLVDHPSTVHQTNTDPGKGNALQVVLASPPQTALTSTYLPSLFATDLHTGMRGIAAQRGHAQHPKLHRRRQRVREKHEGLPLREGSVPEQDFAQSGECGDARRPPVHPEGHVASGRARPCGGSQGENERCGWRDGV